MSVLVHVQGNEDVPVAASGDYVRHCITAAYVASATGEMMTMMMMTSMNILMIAIDQCTINAMSYNIF